MDSIPSQEEKSRIWYTCPMARDDFNKIIENEDQFQVIMGTGNLSKKASFMPFYYFPDAYDILGVDEVQLISYYKFDALQKLNFEEYFKIIGIVYNIFN